MPAKFKSSVVDGIDLSKIDDTLLVTHSGCMDGAGCVISFLRAGGKRKNVKTVAPAQTRPVMWKLQAENDQRQVIFADVAPTSPEEIEFYTRRGGAVVLDHHTSAHSLASLSWCEIDSSRCGSVLMLDYLQAIGEKHNTRLVAMALDLNFLCVAIDDHDRWLNRLKESDQLAVFMKVVGFDRFVDRFYDDAEVVWDEAEKYAIDAAVSRRNGYAAKLAKNPRIRFVDGYTVGFVIASEHVSYVLHEVLKKNAAIEIAAAIDFSNNVVSLRSNDPCFDCNALAQKYGGGGHTTAAAYRFGGDVPDSVIEAVVG